MKILVTGGLGFIGSHTTIELINNGHEVYRKQMASKMGKEQNQRLQ